MIAVDTNVLLRVLVDDDDRQSAAGLRLLQSGEPVLLLNTVLLECVWVLESVYGVGVNAVADVLHDLLQMPGVVLETPAALAAVEWYRSGMDFADAVHLAGAAAHCSKLASFDAGFVRKARGKSTCVVMKPA